MPDDDKDKITGVETTASVGQLVSIVPVFQLVAKFRFGKYVFYFLNPDAVTTFLSLVEAKGSIVELSARKKGKKYYLVEEENVLGEEIDVIELDRDGVLNCFESLEEKMRIIISEFRPLEFGLTDVIVRRILES